MPDAHQRFENRLHQHARRIIPPGSFVLPLGVALALGDEVMAKTFAHAHHNPDMPRILPPEIVRNIGNGSIANGRKVLNKFVQRVQRHPHRFQSGGAVEPDELADVGAVPKPGQTVPPVNARPMTGQAAMTALGIPDIATMTPEEQQMFALGAVPMLAAGPEAKIAEEAAPEIAQAARQGIRAYHGSPYDFDQFDLSKIGTGQGAQTFGHGIYAAENPEVAKTYRPVPGSSSDPSGKSKMYELSINADPEHFLDWDKPLSQQSDAVKNRLSKIPSKVFDDLQDLAENHGYNAPESHVDPDYNGSHLWKYLKRLTSEGPYFDVPEGSHPGAEEEVTNYLKSLGIPGIKYLDQRSRPFGPNASSYLLTRNYVVFDDKLIDIVRKYGLAGLIAAGAAHFKLPADQQSEPEAEQSRGGKVDYYYERVPLRRARGGRVGKMTKQAAHYRPGFEDNKFCARCSMFREPASCTAVAGTIGRTDLCDLFEKT